MRKTVISLGVSRITFLFSFLLRFCFLQFLPFLSRPLSCGYLLGKHLLPIPAGRSLASLDLGPHKDHSICGGVGQSRWILDAQPRDWPCRCYMVVPS